MEARMRVDELIEVLKAMPPESRVVVLGYESGYDDITQVKGLAIMPEESPSWYNGRYDVAPEELTDQAEHAVLLFGRNADK
jgi:hypothetical protein